MISLVKIKRFKSLEDVDVDLGQINVFIGANGSGKSNFLEAVGVLSAAADGVVSDSRLLERGVRPGVPSLYRSSFKGSSDEHSSLSLVAKGITTETAYAVELSNPSDRPAESWSYRAEALKSGGRSIVRRLVKNGEISPGRQNGMAALKAAELRSNSDSAAMEFLQTLQRFVIYSPTTSVLRGISPEMQPRSPVGLSGGQLPSALHQLMEAGKKSSYAKNVSKDALRLIDWAKSFGAAAATSLPLSPAAAASPRVIRFVDRFMDESRNTLSGYDASEGALFVLFLAVIAGHPDSPRFCAVDNADHGLNPRLARSLMRCLCDWYLDAPVAKQILLTTHNPLVLDGLKLNDDRVRLFTVARTETGRTSIDRVLITPELVKKAEAGWSLSRLWVMGHLGGLPDV